MRVSEPTSNRNNRNSLNEISPSAPKQRRIGLNWRLAALVVVLLAVAFVSGLIADKGSHGAKAAERTSEDGLWQDLNQSLIGPTGERKIVPTSYRTLRLDLDALKAKLAQAPLEFTEEAKTQPVLITLPLPDGSFSRFRLARSQMMEPKLAEKFPEITTYFGQGVDGAGLSVGVTMTPDGFHAFVLTPAGVISVDPYSDGNVIDYISYYKKDDPREQAAHCALAEAIDAESAQALLASPTNFETGRITHTYRFVAAATGEFTFNNGGTIMGAQSAIVTKMVAVNLIFRVETTINLQLVDNVAVIYTDPLTDPYTDNNLNNLIAENQVTLTNVIGPANYDLGQVFAWTSGGGLASLGSPCIDQRKGSATTVGNAVVIAVHETAHQLGATHTFNDGTNGACGSFNGGNQRDGDTAYEPASGSTVLSYGGTCARGDLKPFRDAYLHAISIIQIKFFSGGDNPGNLCGTVSDSGNTPPHITGLPPAQSHIPILTPFALSASATDADSDTMSYNWEEFDLGAASPPETDNGDRPIFRSYPPVLSNGVRNFPSLQYILNNSNVPPPTYAGGCFAPGAPTIPPAPANPPVPVNCITGELLLSRDREMKFIVTVRDGRGGVAQNNTDIRVTSHLTSGPFSVTQPNTPVAWTEGTPRTITWSVNNTNVAPVSCANVKISLSVDGGVSFPYVLADNTTNDGSESVEIPFLQSSTARLKVEAIGNIFFDISDVNFTIKPLGVTTNADNGDNLSPTPGSLREAIIDANNIGGLDIIRFIEGAGTMVISPISPLPAITDPVIIDGWSRGGPGYDGLPLVELRGTFAGANAEGLHISGGGSTVKGVAIVGFSSHGIVLQTSGNNAIYGCHLGINSMGGPFGNGGYGVFIVGTSNNLVGGNNAQSQNLIGANNTGVVISGSTAFENIIQNNYIGTDPAGSDLGNVLQGVSLIDAPLNTITGSFISGNGSDGIKIAGNLSNGTIIRGNFVGIGISGTTAVSNGGAGIHISNAPNTNIGGNTGAGGNVISGNSGGGVAVRGAGSFSTRIQTNYLGTNVAGNAAIPNNSFNIYVESAHNIIGGIQPGDRNVISGGSTGVVLAFFGASDNHILGNYIGTNAIGTVALNSTSTGIEIRGGSNNVIGGSVPAARNLISGNGFGIYLVAGANNNQVQGNYIGTNLAGNAGIGNRFHGVAIEGATGNVIGGTAPGVGNVISGNGAAGGFNGVTIASASANTVQGNLIGTNAAGTVAIGNGGFGISLSGPEPSNNNVIGGATAAARNVISANADDGIRLIGNNNTVRGNYIGTDITGQLNLGNGRIGIEISGTDNNQIGGIAPGEGNLIAFNGVLNANAGDGVRVSSSTVDGITHGVGNRIRGNSIHSNRRLGIDLLGGVETNGVTANDDCDGDAGINSPNKLQNYPVISAANSAGGSTTISGTLNSTPIASYTIDFYASPSCNASGNGEGKSYLGSVTVNFLSACTANINAVLPVTLPVGSVITATATDASGNTSEFSACFAATVVPPIANNAVSDFDGDGKTDVSVFRSSSGTWYSNRSTAGFFASQFGANGDKIVPGDYDGDRKTDVAVWRPAAGIWYRLNSSDGAFTSIQFGQDGDVPLPGDYDGDGKSDLSVFRPSTGTFYLLYSTDGSFHYQQWGTNGDVPLMGDYDGDHKTDFAVFRPSAGAFYILQSSNGVVRGQQFGQNGDKPIAGDVDGDGKADLCVFRPANGGWYSLYSTDGSFHGTAWGTLGDLTAAGDYDGDGRMDIGVFRPSTGVFYILQSANGALKAEQFGINGDMPVTSAYVPTP